jgi:hypothetical protein
VESKRQGREVCGGYLLCVNRAVAVRLLHCVLCCLVKVVYIPHRLVNSVIKQ